MLCKANIGFAKFQNCQEQFLFPVLSPQAIRCFPSISSITHNRFCFDNSQFFLESEVFLQYTRYGIVYSPFFLGNFAKPPLALTIFTLKSQNCGLCHFQLGAINASQIPAYCHSYAWASTILLVSSWRAFKHYLPFPTICLLVSDPFFFEARSGFVPKSIF